MNTAFLILFCYDVGVRFQVYFSLDSEMISYGPIQIHEGIKERIKQTKVTWALIIFFCCGKWPATGLFYLCLFWICPKFLVSNSVTGQGCPQKWRFLGPGTSSFHSLLASPHGSQDLWAKEQNNFQGYIPSCCTFTLTHGPEYFCLFIWFPQANETEDPQCVGGMPSVKCGSSMNVKGKVAKENQHSIMPQ